jgi:hypothetical protein
VTGGFRHPDATWFPYAKVRSAAVHCGEPPPIDVDTVRSFESSVRDTLNEYLGFAADKGIAR